MDRLQVLLPPSRLQLRPGSRLMLPQRPYLPPICLPLKSRPRFRCQFPNLLYYPRRYLWNCHPNCLRSLRPKILPEFPLAGPVQSVRLLP